MSLQSEPADDRVLVLTPFGRDAEMVSDRLSRAGFECEACPSVDAMLASMSAPAGAALIAQEALADGGAEKVLAYLEAQEPWSDLPVILLAEAPRHDGYQAEVEFAIFERANVTLLERPVGVRLLASTVRAAIRARRRQYETRDILRDLKRAIELGDMFVSILAHDLRTPLGSIGMGAQVILQGAREPEVLRPAGRILRSADRMTHMIDQLLDLAAVRRSEGVVLQLAEADLAAITWPIVQEIEDAYPETEIELIKRGHMAGTWDAGRLGRVVSNLLGNAVKHGTKDMPVRVDLDGTEADRVRIRVTNSGRIPAELVPTLFDPFKRVRPAKTG
ncbi:MAG: sensor histidine kinase, partial [Myxococcota bacterium]